MEKKLVPEVNNHIQKDMLVCWKAIYCISLYNSDDSMVTFRDTINQGFWKCCGGGGGFVVVACFLFYKYGKISFTLELIENAIKCLHFLSLTWDLVMSLISFPKNTHLKHEGEMERTRYSYMCMYIHIYIYMHINIYIHIRKSGRRRARHAL